MSTNRRRIGRNLVGVGGMSEGAYCFFSLGPFFDGAEWAAGKTEAEIQSFWNDHRSAIMSRFMGDLRLRGPGWAGSRPEYFWKELSEPRLPVDTTLGANEVYDLKKVGFDGLEADYAYLLRLGLLEPWEVDSGTKLE